MGMLVNGRWTDDEATATAGGDGRFLRPDSIFRGRVTRDGAAGFKAEPGRYHLVTAPSCPWAHRTVMMRKLKRLDGAISILESDRPKQQGWAYSRGFDDPRAGRRRIPCPPGLQRRATGLYRTRDRAGAVGPQDADDRQQ